ncbi:MAG: thioredoxin family protein [Bacteroidota bacterium]
MKKFFADKRIQNGMTYQTYFNQFNHYLNQSENGYQTKEAIEKFNNIKLNYQRSLRIHKTYEPSNELVKTIQQIDVPQIWMVISEHWCGDSAQNLPYIAEIAKLNSNIDLRVVLRDDNPDIMDEYLTEGKLRSIPKLVAFDEDGNELFQWGPRPKSAGDLVMNAKKEGKEKNEFMTLLHKWYANNKGEELEKEILFLISENIFTNN